MAYYVTLIKKSYVHVFKVLVIFLLKNIFCATFVKVMQVVRLFINPKPFNGIGGTWRFMEKLYLYFDRFWPVSWQLQHRFLLCCAFGHGLAQNWSFQTVVKTMRGRHPRHSRDSWAAFSGQQKPALAHSFLKECAFVLDLSPASKETSVACASSWVS